MNKKDETGLRNSLHIWKINEQISNEASNRIKMKVIGEMKRINNKQYKLFRWSYLYVPATALAVLFAFFNLRYKSITADDNFSLYISDDNNFIVCVKPEEKGEIILEILGNNQKVVGESSELVEKGVSRCIKTNVSAIPSGKYKYKLIIDTKLLKKTLIQDSITIL